MHSRIGIVRSAVLVPLLSAAVGLAAAGPAYAGKPSSGGSTSGKCSVSPSTVSIGQDYTIAGSGLGAYTIVNVTVTDAGGVTSFSLQADAYGSTSVVSRSYYSGTDSVKFTTSSGHKSSTVLATCSFSVA